MYDLAEENRFVTALVERDDVFALGLLGGDGIDFLLFSTDLDAYTVNSGTVPGYELLASSAPPKDDLIERRVKMADYDIGLFLASPEWAYDRERTERIVRAGLFAVYDPNGLIATLLNLFSIEHPTFADDFRMGGPEPQA